MTPEQINIAIAESVGLKVQDVPFTPAFLDLSRVYLTNRAFNLYRKTFPSGSIPMRVPDYRNDLNAMHEIEKTLTPEQEEDYVDRLGEAVMQTAYEDDKRWMESNLSSFDSTYRATARQRAEAYLRTIGKWKK